MEKAFIKSDKYNDLSNILMYALNTRALPVPPANPPGLMARARPA
jgi:hypothetical protein